MTENNIHSKPIILNLDSIISKKEIPVFDMSNVTIPEKSKIMINCKICAKLIEVLKKNTKFCAECKHEKQKAVCRDYKARNREHISKYNKSYKSEHKADISDYNFSYNLENRAAINAYRYNREQTDPIFKMRVNASVRISSALKERKADYRTMELLGCSLEHFEEWLQFQFTGNLTLENYGSYWHMDHVIPCAKFDLSLDEEIKKCFHWSNVQPLEAKRNVSKGDRTNIMEQVMQELKIKAFIKLRTNTDYTIIEYDRSQYIK